MPPRIPPAAVPEPTVYDAARVRTALDEFSTAAGNGIVTRAELQTAAGSLAALRPAERQSFIRGLAAAPADGASMLRRFVQEAVTRGIGPLAGLPAAEHDALLRELVTAQTSTQLLQIFEAFEHKPLFGAPRPGEAWRQRFAAAVGRHAAPAQRLAFIAHLQDAAVRGNDSAARAIAEVIAAMDQTAEIDAALGTLSRVGMDAVARAAVQYRTDITAGSVGQTSVAASTDTRLFAQLAKAVAYAGNAREKASFVAASGLAFEQLERAGGQFHAARERGRVLDGVFAVIAADVNGVIENTLLQEGAQGGSSGPRALKLAHQGWIEAGQVDRVADIVARLHAGNDLRQDPLARFESQTVRAGVRGHHRAQTLGHYIGTVVAGINAMTSQRDKVTAFSAIGIGGGSDVAKENLGELFRPSKLGIAVSAAVFKTAINAALLQIRVEQAAADKKLWQQLETSGMPLQPSGVRSRDTAAEAAFSAGRDRGVNLS